MKPNSWKSHAFISLLGFGLALFALQVDPEDGIQQHNDLLKADGKIAWVENYTYGTRFGLLGVTKKFNYPSKGRGMGAVRDALENAGDNNVSILHESDTHGPIYSDERYHDVWVINIGGQSIRTYEETLEAWKEDNNIAPWLGWIFLISSLFLGFVSWHKYKNSQ